MLKSLQKESALSAIKRDEGAVWHNDNMLDLYSGVFVSNPDRETAYPDWTQSVRANATIVPRLRYEQFLPNPFQFIVLSDAADCAIL